MAITEKVLLTGGIVLFDIAVLMAIIRIFFKRGLRLGIITGILAASALIFATGAAISIVLPLILPAHGQAAQGAYSQRVTSDIRLLFHKSPAQVEQVLGQPDGPVGPVPGGDHMVSLRGGRRVPATMAMYMGGTVQITYLQNKAARIWVILRGPNTYPDDIRKIAPIFGIPVAKTEVQKIYGLDWENPAPGIHRVQIGISDGRVTEIGVIFLESEDFV